MKKTLQHTYDAREYPAIALLCLRTTPIETGLPSPAEMMFGETMQSNLTTVNITEKDKACRREQWKRQYNERSHTLKYLNRGQSVRVQDYTTKKWEPAMINQKLSQPRSYMLTTNTGSQYRRNRRHIRTTTEVFRIPERHHDESATREPTVVNRAERPTC